MEDQKTSNSPIQKDAEEKIFDLTSDMALEDQDNADIIDLTNAIETPDNPPQDDAPTPAPEPLGPAHETDQAVDGDADAKALPPESERSVTTADTAGAIPLFDQLSGITQQVDNALEEFPQDPADGENRDASSAFPTEAPEPFDAPMEDPLPTDALHHAPESITQENGTGPIADAPMADPAPGESGDDTGMDLNAAIDPPEEMPDDDDVMELTDIVQPAESEALDALYMNEVVEPDISPDLGAPLTEFTAPQPQSAAPNNEPDEDDQIIQLSDILNQPNRSDKPSMAEVKVGAEEDLEAAPIPIEQEVEANTLGLDMVEDAALEQKIREVVEKVLRDNFDGTIEPLISRAVADAVRREMAAIRRTPPEDDQS